MLEQRRNEASKLYVLGLKLFIKHKQKFVEMSIEMVDKLRSMLMAHHNNRWQKIMKIKKQLTRINETELMISRYQKVCFTEDKSKNQYESDMIAIKMLITRNKQAYQHLPKHEKLRMNLNLSKPAYRLLCKK